jgi:predicted MFS family arabinose efflux permease
MQIETLDKMKGDKSALVIACILHAVVIGAGYMSLPPLFSDMAAEGWSPTTIEQSWALIPLGSAPAAQLTASLLKRWSERSLTLVATLVAALAVFTRALAPSAAALAGALFIFGIATGALLVILTSQVSRLGPSEHQGRAQAAFFGAYAFGSAIGLISANSLGDLFGGWRSVAIFWSIVIVCSALLLWMPTSDAYQRQKNVSDKPAFSNLRQPGLLRFALAYAGYVGGYLGLTGLLPYQLRKLDWSPTAADIAMALSTMCFILGAAVIGSATDKFGKRRGTYTATMFLTAICAITAWELALSGYILAAQIAIAGIGFFGGGMTLFFVLLTERYNADADLLTASVGTVTTASYLGGFLIPFAAAGSIEHSPTLAVIAFCISIACAGLLVSLTSD